jgi:hypothetical protein
VFAELDELIGFPSIRVCQEYIWGCTIAIGHSKAIFEEIESDFSLSDAPNKFKLMTVLALNVIQNFLLFDILLSIAPNTFYFLQYIERDTKLSTRSTLHTQIHFISSTGTCYRIPLPSCGS